MDELRNRLYSVPHAYEDFVVGVMLYAEQKASRFRYIMDYLNVNPQASVSDVLLFISLQPDFYEDSSIIQGARR